MLQIYESALLLCFFIYLHTAVCLLQSPKCHFSAFLRCYCKHTNFLSFFSFSEIQTSATYWEFSHMPPAQHSLHKSTQILLVSLRLNFLMYTSNLIFPKLSSCCFFQKMGAFCHFSVSDSVAQTRKLGIILDSSTFLHCKCILPPKYFSNSQTSFLLLFYSHKL